MSLIDKFMSVEAAVYPGASYRIKDKLLRHKIAAFIMKPFNPRYLQRVTTTVHPHTDFGTEHAGHALAMTKIEFHENVHKWDFRKGLKWAMVKYAFPQIAAFPFLVGAFVSAGWVGLAGFVGLVLSVFTGLVCANTNLNKDKEVTPYGMKVFGALTALGVLVGLGCCVYGAGWWVLSLFALAGVFVSPWPFRAVWRRDYELRGYTASLYQEWLRHGRIRDDVLDYYILQFTGSTYFFMETRRKLVREALTFQISRFREDEAQFLEAWVWSGKKPDRDGAEPFRMIKRFFDQEKLYNA